jgi:hypothetical protein
MSNDEVWNRFAQSKLRSDAAPPRKGQRDFTSDFKKIRCSTSAALLKRSAPKAQRSFILEPFTFDL